MRAQDVAVHPAPPRPRTAAPPLAVDLVGGGRWDLAEQDPPHFTMIVFYRGLHCPVCRGQLVTIEERHEELRLLGVEPVVISADDRHRAERARDEWGLPTLPIGYGLTLPVMRSWGLFVSASTTDEEPERFSEPGTFLIGRDRQVYYAALTTMPFGRPQLDDLLGGIDFVTRTGYPARGDR